MKRRKRAGHLKIFTTSLIIIAFITLVIATRVIFANAGTNGDNGEIIENEFPMAINHLLSNDLSNLPEAKKLDAQIEKFMREWRIKGASIAIMKDEKLIYTKGYGWADEEDSVRTDVRHIFRIASLSKLITATAIMTMVEENLINLSSKPFAKGGILDLPQFKNIKDNRVRDITIEDLLRHQGGFTLRGGDPLFNTPLVRSRMHLDSVPGTDDVIAYSISHNLGFTPGKGTRYSNLGYLILSRIIEVVSGKDYEEYVKERVLLPAGIYDMHLAKNFYEDKFPNEVRYYEPDNEEMVEAYDGSGSMRPRCYGGNNIEGLMGAGAWVASPSELLLFVASIDGKPDVPDIISKKSINIMTSSTPKLLPIGWAKVNSNGDWSRTGTLSGTSALLKYQRDGFSWVLITNTSSWKGARFPRKIDALFDKTMQSVIVWPERNLFDTKSLN
ncbi:MAG: serine hydrolase domain-containing protein [Bacteroidales bacterium]|jgi:CubicO group peptidase (beta-lactamase class C family)